MKTITFSFFFFLLLNYTSIGQVKPRLYKVVTSKEEFTLDDYIISSIKNISYHYSGKISQEVTDTYQFNQMVSRDGIFYTYDNQNNLIKKTSRRYNSDLGLWITVSWFEYTYDENGCEIESNFIRNIGGQRSNYIYGRDENCNLLSSGRWTTYSNFEPPLVFNERLYTYFQDDVSYEEVSRSYDIPTDEVFLQKRWVTKFNSQQLIEKYYKLLENSNEWFGTKLVNTYDDQKNMAVIQM